MANQKVLEIDRKTGRPTNLNFYYPHSRHDFDSDENFIEDVNFWDAEASRIRQELRTGEPDPCLYPNWADNETYKSDLRIYEGQQSMEKAQESFNQRHKPERAWSLSEKILMDGSPKDIKRLQEHSEISRYVNEAIAEGNKQLAYGNTKKAQEYFNRAAWFSRGADEVVEKEPFDVLVKEREVDENFRIGSIEEILAMPVEQRQQYIEDERNSDRINRFLAAGEEADTEFSYYRIGGNIKSDFDPNLPETSDIKKFFHPGQTSSQIAKEAAAHNISSLDFLLKTYPHLRTKVVEEKGEVKAEEEAKPKSFLESLDQKGFEEVMELRTGKKF